MYKFVKGSRLFMQAKREDTDYDNVADVAAGFNGTAAVDDGDNVDEIRAVHTYRNTDMEGTTSGERWSKSVKRGNIRHRSTRTVRKVTTITRGEQSVTSETVLNYQNENKQSYPTVNNNKQNLKFRVVEKVTCPPPTSCPPLSPSHSNTTMPTGDSKLAQFFLCYCTKAKQQASVDSSPLFLLEHSCVFIHQPELEILRGC